MALDKLLETDNFDAWLVRINEIIDSLGKADTLTNQLLEALAEAIERNQASEFLGNPSGTITLPDGTVVNAGTFLSWDWNEYVRNGVYWIPFVSGQTSNAPRVDNVPMTGICWVASGGENGPTVQIAAAFKEAPTSAQLPKTPTLLLRFGANENGSISWKSWIEIPNRKYVDDTFLSKVKTSLQSVAGPVDFLKGVTVAEDLTVSGKASVRQGLALKGSSLSTLVLPDDSCHASANGTRHTTFEVGDASTFAPDTSPNLPMWSSSTGAYVPPAARVKYVEPLWIDKQERVANINGTAEYANFIVPTNMVSKFRAADIAADQLWMPVSAKALKDMYNWSKDTFLPLEGGVLKGVVTHEQDIFLDHLQGIQENRTAAIRSVVRPLQMQCQGSTHLVSNSKQACLYLEKEDADSAEFTVEHHDASFTFRTVALSRELCLENDPNFSILNSDPQSDGYWQCKTSIGTLKLFQSGEWEFIVDERKMSQLGIGQVLKFSLFYRVDNAASGDAIASRCQYDIAFHPGDPHSKSGVLTVNDVHYQIAITDTDWTGLPITSKSRLASGSMLSDGSLIAAGSIINGLEYETDLVVEGLQTSYGVKTEGDDGQPTETPAMLAEGSIIKQGSVLLTGSEVNGQRQTIPTRVNSDIRVATESTLAKGSILKSGSVVALNSVINGFQYTSNETVAGQEISEESELTAGSKICLGSMISTASAINGVPGKAGFLEVLHGRDPSELQAELTNGSSILKGSVLAPGSILNDVEYDSPTVVQQKVYVDGLAKLGHGSRLAAGSWIEAGSIINGLKWANGMKASGIDAVVPLGKEDIAPILYVRTYDNIHGMWESEWNKSSYRTVYPNAGSYDSEMWSNWLTAQIGDILNGVEHEDLKAQVLHDLQESLSNTERTWSYPLRTNPDSLLVHGAWELKISESNAPDHVFPTRCYIASNSRSIMVERLTVQPFRNVYDENGTKIDAIAVHDPVTIFKDSTAVSASFLGKAFEYFNFSVIPGYGSKYVVAFDTRLIPEQENLNKDKVSEVLTFKGYAGTIDASGDPVVSFEKTISLNVKEMMGAPFVFGARTRTGITSTGQLGDPLYDLGCVEIAEDSMAFKLRKRSVTMQSEIKKTASIVFERKTDYNGRIVPYINSETNHWFINGEDTGLPAVGDSAVAPRIEDGFWWIGNVNTGYRASDENVNAGISLRPSVNGVDLGIAELRFRNLYLEGEPIVSSDRNLKTDIAEFPDSLLNKWAKVQWTSFKFKDSVEKKGKKARIHAGVIAQDVQKALRGTDVSKWSFFCKDQWDDRKEAEYVDVPAGKDEFGVFRDAHTERRIVVSNKAGEQYSIRYQEMQCIENAYLRREIETLRKEIEQLKKKLK